MKTIRTLAFTLYGLFVIAVLLVSWLINLQYEDPLGFFVAFIFAPVFGFMFYLPGELPFKLNKGIAIPGQDIVSFIIGMAFCGVDFWRHRRRSKAMHAAQPGVGHDGIGGNRTIKSATRRFRSWLRREKHVTFGTR